MLFIYEGDFCCGVIEKQSNFIDYSVVLLYSVEWHMLYDLFIQMNKLAIIYQPAVML